MNYPNWAPDQYLKFEKERTRPSVDLVSRIAVSNPMRIIDIGCGPGNSTMILKNRWQNAQIVGLDSSEVMLKKADALSTEIQWIHDNVEQDLSQYGKFDIVFSNAAIHHVADKHDVLRRLFQLLNPEGALAVQIPYTKELPFFIELQRLVSSEKWSKKFGAFDYSSRFCNYSTYYEIISGLSSHIELWQTDYIQVTSDHSSIVEWYKGSGLRPYLALLENESEKEEFLSEYRQSLIRVYPKEKNGMILFPIRRIFFLVYHSGE